MNRIAQSPRVRQLTVADLTDIVELRRAVTAELPLGYIRSKTESDLRSYLDGTLGAAYGVCEGDALLAMSLLRVPDEEYPNNAWLPFLRVPEEDWPLRACMVENAMVLPAARGRGFQRVLFDVLLSHAASAQMRWICAAVHFRNSVSWINLLAKKMAIVGIRSDAGYPLVGLLRGVDALMPASDSSDRISVAVRDLSQHQTALQDGYVGARLAPDGAVVYQRASLHRARSKCLRQTADLQLS